MSIRLRLTLLYTAMVAITLTLFGLSVYVVQDRTARSAFEQSLEDDMRRFDRPPMPGGPPPHDLNGPIDPGRLGTYFQVRNPQGEILRRSNNLGDLNLPLSNEGEASLAQGKPWVEVVVLNNERLLIVSRPIREPGGEMLYIQAARSIREQELGLATLRRFLGLGALLSIFGTMGLAWIVAGLSLRPIKHVTRTAAQIGLARDFSQRVTYRGPQDEIGRLATTFNNMLVELEAAYQQTEAALAAQTRFVADASHELRTPLTTIRGNLALLDRHPPLPPEDQREVLEDTLAETNRLIRLVQDLLTLARNDTNRSLALEAISLQPLLDELCRQAQHLSPHHQLACPGDVPYVVQANADALKQVLLILLDNAVRHTPPQTQIQLKVGVVAENIKIQVIDNGPGIPADQFDRLFDRFFQGDVSRTGEGSGLGLAIAHALMLAQGGIIEVQSRPGEGCIFTLQLAQAAATAAAPPTETTIKTSSNP